MASLLGASPGASVGVDAMLELLSRAFPEEFGSWQDKIKEMIPTYGVSLSDNPEIFKEMNERTTDTLRLKSHEKGALLS